jgi:hypothetical protein
MGFLSVRGKASCSALAALLLVLSCRAPTQVVVELSTDISCADGPRTGLSVGSLSELESRPLSTETLRCDPATGRIGSIVVVPGGEKDSEVTIRVVTGMTMSPEECVQNGYVGGCVVARRILHFEPHDTLYLPIRMEASCLDVPCGATETCRAGSCVTAVVDGSTGGSGGSGGMTNPPLGGGGANSDSAGTSGTPGTAGAPSSGGTTGGASGGTTGGASGGTAGDPTGGTAAMGGGAPTSSFTPTCNTTAGGVLIHEGVACNASDTQLCYSPCGPLDTGRKALTCTSGAYAEGVCQFPNDVSYSCFTVPQQDAPACPATVPQASQPCSVATCSLPCSGSACEMCGVANGYRDSLGNAKTGYCVCKAGSNGNRWACASVISWPCPDGQGC